MNIWAKRLLVLLSVGGGYFGLVIISPLLFQKGGNAMDYLLTLGLMAFSFFGICCGLELMENEQKGLKALRWFYVLQIDKIE